ncbi:MAG: rRNA maturation RNase YbeY [Pseudomonadota bacterium]
MPVDLQFADGIQAEILVGDLQVWLAQVAVTADADITSALLCVRVCDEAESRQLNMTYRGIDKPTNVLSFAADVDVPDVQVLGDLAICWPVVEQEAAAQAKLVAHHFMHLFVHGVLHLLGFDHEDSAEAHQMETLEIRILRQLGVTNPYEAPLAGA